MRPQIPHVRSSRLKPNIQSSGHFHGIMYNPDYIYVYFFLAESIFFGNVKDRMDKQKKNSAKTRHIHLNNSTTKYFILDWADTTST